MTRSYKYYDLVMVAFVVVLICANLIGPAKIAEVGGFAFGAGVLFFPFSYIFGDILTEVYGYARARRVVWAGFAGLAFAAFMCWAVLAFPPAPFWHDQAALETALGSTWRIVLASLCAFWAGEFVNSYVLARIKVWMAGKALYVRTIGSTIAGQAIDSMVFYTVAFAFIWPWEQVLLIMATNYGLKVLWEVVMTPFTYLIVGWLKKAEGEDYFDRDTNFTPFSLKT
ncbi:MAG: queuosine precursor transporter [Gammaproteobacteria bacterium]|nr:queuosine precursor transporter [Gammaproteobacteria bacterium]